MKACPMECAELIRIWFPTLPSRSLVLVDNLVLLRPPPPLPTARRVKRRIPIALPEAAVLAPLPHPVVPAHPLPPPRLLKPLLHGIRAEPAHDGARDRREAPRLLVSSGVRPGPVALPV